MDCQKGKRKAGSLQAANPALDRTGAGVRKPPHQRQNSGRDDGGGRGGRGGRRWGVVRETVRDFGRG